MNRLPSLFVSHGAPTLPIDPALPSAGFAALATRIPRPKSILMVSAHWETEHPVASVAELPQTIHDFRGFPQALHDLQYPAPGDPVLGARAANLLSAAGIPATTEKRGLDHGAWVPLLLMFPGADIPVAQLSIQPHLGPDHHWRMGRALRALRDEGALIVGSGQITHNLREADFRARPADADPKVLEFTQWFEDRMRSRDTEALLDYRRRAPHAAFMHPRDDHLLPIFTALGAADDDFTTDIQSLGTFQRSLAMTNYVFGMG